MLFGGFIPQNTTFMIITISETTPIPTQKPISIPKKDVVPNRFKSENVNEANSRSSHSFARSRTIASSIPWGTEPIHLSKHRTNSSRSGSFVCDSFPDLISWVYAASASSISGKDTEVELRSCDTITQLQCSSTLDSNCLVSLIPSLYGLVADFLSRSSTSRMSDK